LKLIFPEANLTALSVNIHSPQVLTNGAFDMFGKFLAFGVLTLALTAPTVHAAGIDGDTVAVNIVYPKDGYLNGSFGSSIITQGGVTFNEIFGETYTHQFFVTPSSIVFTQLKRENYKGGDYFGLLLTNLTSTIPGVYKLDMATNTAGFTEASYTTSGNHFQLNLTGLILVKDATATFNLVPAVAAVPEPETWAMLLAGLGLMGSVARRRKCRMPGASTALQPA
jgi:hypothetical protein